MPKFNVRRVAQVASSAALMAGAAAHAALPTGVDTAVTGAQTDGTTLIGSLAVAGAAVFLIAKLLKKFGIFL